MELEKVARKELIDSLLSVMVTPNVKSSVHSESDEAKFNKFIKDVSLGKQASVQLPLDYALNNSMFNLIKAQRVFIESSVKFVTTFSTKEPENNISNVFTARYVGNEFNYSFLDNHQQFFVH